MLVKQNIMKQKIIDVLNKYKFMVDNHNDAVFEEDFEKVSDEVVKIYNEEKQFLITEFIIKLQFLKSQL